uniref:Uncharacterized protein n=1 Tax=Timema cristinae TaxID=61476 RepID=A0A7R9DBQ9_TIMCR|nr:unnamed protein product [Timema cristinae]
MRGLLVCVLTVVLMVSVRASILSIKSDSCISHDLAYECMNGSPTKEEIISMIKAFGDKCLEERKINLTDADQELLKMKKCPNSDEAKCWLSCLSEHFDLVSSYTNYLHK